MFKKKIQDELLEQPTDNFNVHLEHAKTTLFLLADYLRFRQIEDFDQMYNSLDNIVSFNYAKIDTTKIDKKLDWLEENKDKWCIKDKETGNIKKVNYENKKIILKAFRDTFRILIKELDKHGVIRKHELDPSMAMSRFD